MFVVHVYACGKYTTEYFINGDSEKRKKYEFYRVFFFFFTISKVLFFETGKKRKYFQSLFRSNDVRFGPGGRAESKNNSDGIVIVGETRSVERHDALPVIASYYGRWQPNSVRRLQTRRSFIPLPIF